ncbi:MAG: pyridoxal phosphate-dependent aminotransferase [Candidatus Kerfeldbacteria bacterium]|nr:pyridoxal phosphate-dependent aminotransferase [Candidatus Kerfeldbacteria bacterium]
MTLRISQRGRTVPASPMRTFHAKAMRAQRQGVAVHFVNIGQPDLPTPASFTHALRRYRGAVVGYAPSLGYPEVRQAWQQYYLQAKIHVSIDNIIATVGGSEALQFALMSVADPGDEVLIFEPTYPSYISFARMLGVKTVPIPLSITNGYHLPSTKEIERHISKRTRAIIICNPSNPTGTILSDAEMHRLARLARQHSLFIIADEVYREFNFRASVTHSFLNMRSIQKQLIVVDSVSKRFNLCGARVGALVSRNRQVLESCERFAQSRLSAATIEQLSVIPLLRQNKKYLHSVRLIYRTRRDAVVRALKKLPGVTTYVPEGGLYVMAGLPVRDVAHFAEWLVSKYTYQGETVLIAPGSGFYQTPRAGKHEVRIAFVLSPALLRRAVNIIGLALSAYHLQFPRYAIH